MQGWWELSTPTLNQITFHVLLNHIHPGYSLVPITTLWVFGAGWFLSSDKRKKAKDNLQWIKIDHHYSAFLTADSSAFVEWCGCFFLFVCSWFLGWQFICQTEWLNVETPDEYWNKLWQHHRRWIIGGTEFRHLFDVEKHSISSFTVSHCTAVFFDYCQFQNISVLTSLCQLRHVDGDKYVL